MSVHNKPGGQMNRDRYSELKRILEERRREIMEQVQVKIRDVRSEGANNPNQGVLDAVESSEADIQDDIEFALIQMKSETLSKVNEALRGEKVLAVPAGENVLRLLPPLTISDEDLEQGLRILAESL